MRDRSLGEGKAGVQGEDINYICLGVTEEVAGIG